MDFLGGDVLNVSAAAFWVTPARRTMVWTHKENHNNIPLCTEANPLFAMKELSSSDTTKVSDWGLSYAIDDTIVNKVELIWNHGELVASSGGTMYLQRRNESFASQGPNAGWRYIMDIDKITGGDAQAWSNYGQFTATSDEVPTDEKGHPLDAKKWTNADVNPANGQVDIIRYTDSTLFESLWSCETVQYRVVQQLCEYPAFPTEPVTLNIMGLMKDPWKAVDTLEDGVFVSEGRYPYKVRIEWDNALDLDGTIDQFRLYRRLYAPSNPDDNAWEQIFSSEDITWFIDQDLAAGVLYEYRVGAFVDCGGGNSSEFFNPTPYPVGWRSAYGGATGKVAYEIGTAVDSAFIKVEPQGDYTARNSLQLADNEWVKIDLAHHAARDGGQLTHFPDIHTASVGEVITLSHWMRLRKSTLEDAVDNKVPLFSMQYVDPLDSREKEFVSFWAEPSSQSSNAFVLSARQAGRFTKLWDFPASYGYADNVEIEYNSFNHLTFSIINEAAPSGSSTPGMKIEIRVHPDDATVDAIQPVTAYRLRGSNADIADYRAHMSAWLWNAAAEGSVACSDPNAANFNPMEFNGELRYCNYDLPQGCTDPFLENVNYLPYSTFDVGGGELECSYSYFGPGEMIYVDWFTDDTSLPLEYPIVERLAGTTWERVHSFRSDLELYSDRLSESGEAYAYSMVTMRLDLPGGQYRIRVLDDTDSQNLETGAENFFGNFAVRSHTQASNPYLTCLQYLESEVAEETYNFEISTSSPIALGEGGINDVLTDISESYSVQFRNNKNIVLPLRSPLETNLGLVGEFSLSWWFRTQSPKHGEAFNLGNVLKLTSANDGSDLSFMLSPDDTPSNLDSIRWRLQGFGDLNRLPENAMRNEYAIQHDRWYHAVLAVKSGNDDGTDELRLILRNISEDTLDTQIWNDPIEFHYVQADANEDVIAPIDLSTPFMVKEIQLGGSDVLIHRLSIWNQALSKANSYELASGASLNKASFEPTTAPLTPGTWESEFLDDHPLPMDKLRSVCVPDNAGRFVDQMTGRQARPDGDSGVENFLESNLLFEGSIQDTDSLLVINGEVLGIYEDSGYEPLPSVNRRSVRRSPRGESIKGCGRVSSACNFNPFANQFVDCDLSCAGVNVTTQKMSAHRMDIDEIRAWAPNIAWDAYNEPLRYIQNVPDPSNPGATMVNPKFEAPYFGYEAAKLYFQKYPNPNLEGLVLMYDADEGLGSILYDRSRYASDLESWREHHAKLYKQNIGYLGTELIYNTLSDSSVVYHGPDEEGLHSMPSSLFNWTYSNIEADGAYAISNIKYDGTGYFFDIKPSKSTGNFSHVFNPAQRTILVGDALQYSENQDFTDKSAFAVDVDVSYLALNTQGHYQIEDGNVTASDCPVSGVKFEVDGSAAKDTANQDVVTDELGRATLYLSKGPHKIKPILVDAVDGNTEDDHAFRWANAPETVMTSEGVSVEVEGATLRDPVTNKADTVFSFIDVTSRRFVGQAIGGTEMASKAWGDSNRQNTLGKTTFQMISEEYDEEFTTYYLNPTCQAAKITTDELGQFDVHLLPKFWRLANRQDTLELSGHEGSPDLFASSGGFNSFNVEGWLLPTINKPESWSGSPWVGAFSVHFKVNGSRTDVDYNSLDYYRLDLTSLKSSWDQSSEYPGTVISTGAEFPSDDGSYPVYARKDFVYQVQPTIAVAQVIPQTITGEIETGNSLVNECDAGDTDHDGICDNKDTCIDVDRDGICDVSSYNYSGTTDLCSNLNACNYNDPNNVNCITGDCGAYKNNNVVSLGGSCSDPLGNPVYAIQSDIHLLQNNFVGQLDLMTTATEAVTAGNGSMSVQEYDYWIGTLPLYIGQAVGNNPDLFENAINATVDYELGSESPNATTSAEVIDQLLEQPPFPLGYPVMYQNTEYCIAVSATERYYAQYETQIPIDVVRPSIGNYSAKILGGLDASGSEKTINMSDGKTYTYRFTTPALTRGDYLNLQPKRSMSIFLYNGDEQIATWKPFEFALGAAPFDDVPGIAKDDNGNSLIGENQFTAMIMGQVAIGDNVPTSGGAVLDFTLRDPPGDLSSCTIEQGSTFAFEREFQSDVAENKGFVQNYGAGLALNAEDGGVLAPMGIGVNTDQPVETSYENKFVVDRTATSNQIDGLTMSEKITCNETVSTSELPLSYFYGTNQDVFYGRTENSMMQVKSSLILQPTGTTINNSMAEFDALFYNDELSGASCNDCAADADNDAICDALDPCVDKDSDGFCYCGDPTACNFDVKGITAGVDPCLFNDALNVCGGTCTADIDEDGICDDAGADNCTDTNYCNYNDAANLACSGTDTDGDGTCDDVDSCIDIDGDSFCESGSYNFSGTLDLCSDLTACNYADADNLACTYPDAIGTCGGSCIQDTDGDGLCDDLSLSDRDLCFDSNACNWDQNTYANHECIGLSGDFDNCASQMLAYGSCFDLDNPDANSSDNSEPVTGCMDAYACNYNPDATVAAAGALGCEYASCTSSASVSNVYVGSSGGCSYYPRGLWNAYGPDGALAYLPMYKVNNDPTTGEYQMTEVKAFNLTWDNEVIIGQAPASYFAKTQYTIENVDIKLLEEARLDKFKSNPNLYQWPDGRASNLPQDTASWKYPEGMFLANNDDQRWYNFHNNWVASAVGDGHILNPIPGIARSYDVGTEAGATGGVNSITYSGAINTANYDVFSILELTDTGATSTTGIFKNLNVSEGSFITITHFGIGNEVTMEATVAIKRNGFLSARIRSISGSANATGGWTVSAGTTGPTTNTVGILAEAQTGLKGDRVGPGYIFLGNDITQDTVRQLNNQINSWKRMLAQNEFDKIAARKFVTNSSFLNTAGGIEDLSDWEEDMEESFYAANNYTLNDFQEMTSTTPDMIEDEEIWDDADFEPFFISFSGGGLGYTSTIQKTNITSRSSQKTISATENASNTFGVNIHQGVLGVSLTESWEKSYTETRKNSSTEESSITYSYTLKDDDEQDFYLVGVIPGRGLDGPIFVTLGGASSCPYDPGETAKYSEFYPDLFPGNEPLTQATMATSGAGTFQTTPVWNVELPTADKHEFQFFGKRCP